MKRSFWTRAASPTNDTFCPPPGAMSCLNRSLAGMNSLRLPSSPPAARSTPIADFSSFGNFSWSCWSSPLFVTGLTNRGVNFPPLASWAENMSWRTSLISRSPESGRMT